MEKLSNEMLRNKYIAQHINDINKLFDARLNRAGYDFLLQLEDMAHKKAEYWCDFSYTDEEREEYEQYILSLICDVLDIDAHDSIFFNSDPRVFALKIKDDFVRESKSNIYRDLGGYGIFAPDFAYLKHPITRDEVQV
jgi:hypothetical protein